MTDDDYSWCEFFSFRAAATSDPIEIEGTNIGRGHSAFTITQLYLFSVDEELKP